MFDIKKIREDFPALHQQVYGRPLIYLDNAATTQKPKQVIDTVSQYYQTFNSNIHRGVHYLSTQATEAYEAVRKKAGAFINASHPHEIIFTRGATESINLVASSFGKKFLTAGDEILITQLEHHSNIVPWQMICEEKNAKLRVIPINSNGELQLDQIESLISEKTRLIALAHVSNALGTINPVKQIITLAHSRNIPVLLDGAQAVPHIPVDVQDLNCDFYCFSGHKIYAPMGIGVLYGKEKWLEELPPYQGGGEMIQEVTFERTTYNELPFKFEAGTPNVGDTLGLGAAIEYLLKIGFESITAWEHSLLEYATIEIGKMEGVKIYGTSPEKAAVISFLCGNNIHPYDIGTIIDKFGVALRTGHHCAQPIMDYYEINGTIRASFAIYNTKEEIDSMIVALKKSIEMLS